MPESNRLSLGYEPNEEPVSPLRCADLLFGCLGTLSAYGSLADGLRIVNPALACVADFLAESLGFEPRGRLFGARPLSKRVHSPFCQLSVPIAFYPEPINSVNRHRHGTANWTHIHTECTHSLILHSPIGGLWHAPARDLAISTKLLSK